MTFKEDIALMIQKQKELDHLMFAKAKLKEYPLNEVKCALFCELGELMQELQAEFKYWKKSAVNNLEKALEEYVDCLHFLLSLYIHENYCTCGSIDIPEYDGYLSERFYENFTLIQLPWAVSHPCHAIGSHFAELWAIGKHLNFTWKQVYEAYMKKNAVNVERAKGDY